MSIVLLSLEKNADFTIDYWLMAVHVTCTPNIISLTTGILRRGLLEDDYMATNNTSVLKRVATMFYESAINNLVVLHIYTEWSVSSHIMLILYSHSGHIDLAGIRLSKNVVNSLTYCF